MMEEEPRHSGDARFSGNWLTVFAGVGLLHMPVYRAAGGKSLPLFLVFVVAGRPQKR